MAGEWEVAVEMAEGSEGEAVLEGSRWQGEGEGAEIKVGGVLKVRRGGCCVSEVKWAGVPALEMSGGKWQVRHGGGSRVTYVIVDADCVYFTSGEFGESKVYFKRVREEQMVGNEGVV